jgi:tRNA threonylcarbamoyl adenosine modification protein YeaZ
MGRRRARRTTRHQLARQPVTLLTVLLLAFDTSTPAVTVALHDGTQVLATHTVIDARRHGELLAPAIAQVLGDASISASDLSGIAVGVGPGPFTGLRIGLMTARAMGDALAIPVTGVCTLDVIAAAVVSAQPFLVATDARRREVYWATYDADGVRIDVDVSGRVRRCAPPGISGRRCARVDGRQRSRGGASPRSAVPTPTGRRRAQPSSSGQRGDPGMNAVTPV